MSVKSAAASLGLQAMPKVPQLVLETKVLEEDEDQGVALAMVEVRVLEEDQDWGVALAMVEVRVLEEDQE